jgi:hypothetical protein
MEFSIEALKETVGRHEKGRFDGKIQSSHVESDEKFMQNRP